MDVQRKIEGATPAARWRESGQSDPHGSRYACERAQLCRGDQTDDEVANAVFMESSIENITAAKDRIRWSSRRLSDTAGIRRSAVRAIADLLLDVSRSPEFLAVSENVKMAAEAGRYDELSDIGIDAAVSVLDEGLRSELPSEVCRAVIHSAVAAYGEVFNPARWNEGDSNVRR